MNRLIVIIVILLLLVFGGGVLIGRWTRPAAPREGAAPATAATQEVWTCSMHPHVRSDGPGTCPTCDMPLVPASTASAGEGVTPMLQLSEHALAMASVETTPVERRHLVRDLRAVGKIEYNESSLATITARVDGYAERLFVNFSGVDIRAGDHLVEIYSPDLLVATQELAIAMQSGSGGSLVETARLKLKLYGLTDAQVDELARGDRRTDRVTLYSPIDGTVIEKMVVQSSAFKAGDVLYRVANLDTVWVYLDVYEFDLPWVRYGQEVRLTAEAYPGREFSGMVTFIQPVLNQATRTIRVPVHVENDDHALKPGMFVSATIRAELGTDGKAAATGVEGSFTCPMHPQVLVEAAGACPICGMPLEQIPPEAGRPGAVQTPSSGFACPMRCEGEKVSGEPGRCPVCNMTLEAVAAEPAEPGAGLLAVPRSAVLDSGTRTIVYVERSRGLFEPREVTLGPRAGEYVPVLLGLRDGERVVTRGGFLIDSQFQISGHASLFYPGGLHAPAGHEHGEGEAAPVPPEAPAPAGHEH